MKKCPFCAEEIQDEAIKCKHCGEWLQKNAQALKAKDIEHSKPLHQDIVSKKPDEEIKEKEAGLKLCPNCGKWDVHKAYVEDGSWGDWCPNCQKSLKEPIKTLTYIQKADNRIKTAWITGVVLGGLATLLSLAKLDISYMIIAILFFGLSYGTLKRSRVCAIMLGFFLLSTIVGAFGAYQGIRGTFAYHKLTKAPQDSPSV